MQKKKRPKKSGYRLKRRTQQQHPNPLKQYAKEIINCCPLNTTFNSVAILIQFDTPPCNLLREAIITVLQKYNSNETRYKILKVPVLYFSVIHFSGSGLQHKLFFFRSISSLQNSHDYVQI